MNDFGKIFKVNIYGESHNSSVGVLIDGIPAGLSLCEEDFYEDLDKRRPHKIGQTTRKEADLPIIESGLFNGFTTGTPWIGVNENYSKVNAQSQIHDETSIFNYYKTLVEKRKEYDIIAYGDIKPVDAKHPSVFAYERTYGDEKLLVVCNFYKNEVEWNSLREFDGYEVILGNYQDQMIKDEKITLRPYEAMMLYKKS